MNIVLFNNRYYPGLGGSETLLKNQAEQLVDRGHKVTVITSDFLNSHGHEKVTKDVSIINGVHVIRLNSFRPFGKDALTVIPGFLRALREAGEVDLVHIYTHGYWTSWWPVLLRKFRLLDQKIKLVYSPHYAPSMNYGGAYVRIYDQTLGNMVVKNVDHMILLTKAYEELFKAKGAKKISIIPPFIEPVKEITEKEQREVKENFGIPEGRTIVFSISRVVWHKGMQFFIEALPKIRKKVPDVLFVIAGDGDNLEKLRKLAKSKGVKKQVRFIGRVSDREKEILFTLSDFFTLLSFSSESFGITMAEAMQAGLPILASNRGAVPYVTIDDRNGVVVDPFNVKEVAEGFLELVANRERFSMQNIKDSELYSPNVVMEKLEDVYYSVINE